MSAPGWPPSAASRPAGRGRVQASLERRELLGRRVARREARPAALAAGSRALDVEARPERPHPGPDVDRQRARVVGGEGRPALGVAEDRIEQRPADPLAEAVRAHEQVGEMDRPARCRSPPRTRRPHRPRPPPARRPWVEQVPEIRARRRPRRRSRRRCRGRRGSPGSPAGRPRSPPGSTGSVPPRRLAPRSPASPAGRTAPSSRAAGRAAARSPVIPSRPVIVVGGDERVEDRLLGRLDRRVEQRADREVVQGPEVRRRRADPPGTTSAAASPVARREAQEQVAARVGAGPAHPGDAEARPLGEAIALVGQERGVGRDDDDDRARAGRRRAGGRRRERSVGESSSSPGSGRGTSATGIASPTGTPSTRSQLPPAVVRLDEDADREAAGRLRRRPATPSRSRP